LLQGWRPGTGASRCLSRESFLAGHIIVNRMETTTSCVCSGVCLLFHCIVSWTCVVRQKNIILFTGCPHRQSRINHETERTLPAVSGKWTSVLEPVDIDRSAVAIDLWSSASFSARKIPQRIPANTPPVIRGLRPRNCLSLLHLVTKARSGRLLGENESEQDAVDRNYERRRASMNKPVNEQRAVK
jgi:hypothetical protein